MMVHSVKCNRRVTGKKSEAAMLGFFPKQNGVKWSPNTNIQSSNRAHRMNTRKTEFMLFLCYPFRSSAGAERKEWIVYLKLKHAYLSTTWSLKRFAYWQISSNCLTIFSTYLRLKIICGRRERQEVGRDFKTPSCKNFGGKRLQKLLSFGSSSKSIWHHSFYK